MALNKFLWNKDKGSFESPSASQSQGFIESLANITSADLNIEDLNEALNLSTRFAATDLALEGVKTWPEKLEFDEQSWPGDFFKSKLSFQIKHGVFRSNLKTGEKTIFEVLKWCDQGLLRSIIFCKAINSFEYIDNQVRLHQLVHPGLHRLLHPRVRGWRVLLVHHRPPGPPQSNRVHRSLGSLRHQILCQWSTISR